MPKKEIENSLGLNEGLIEDWENLVQASEAKGYFTRQELENIYRQTLGKRDTPLGKSIEELGADNYNIQESIINSVKNQLIKMARRPVYNVYFRKDNYQEKYLQDKDDDGNPIKGTDYPGVLIFGIGVLENSKTGVKYTPRFLQVTGYRGNAKKLKGFEESEIGVIQASGANNPGEYKFMKLSVDDRCDDAVVDKDIAVDVPTIDEFLKEKMDVTEVSQVPERLSENDDDWRLLRGKINFLDFPKGKKYAKLEIIDTKISKNFLDDIEKGTPTVNVQVFADKDLVLSVGAGVESKVKILGAVRKSTNPKYNNISMWWPKMIIPEYKVDIADRAKPKSEVKADDQADNTSDYLKQRMAAQQQKKEELPNKVAAEQFKSIPDAIDDALDEIAEETKEESTMDENELVQEALDDGLEEVAVELKEGEAIDWGKSQCSTFGEYNPTDSDCQACENSEEYEELVKACKKYSNNGD